uniref:Mitogen-activated protein kinase n=1 Tax=Steinernema glaseri TaxID=37863 RepID=A0A1I7ZMQ9_9BILA
MYDGGQPFVPPPPQFQQQPPFPPQFNFVPQQLPQQPPMYPQYQPTPRNGDVIGQGSFGYIRRYTDVRLPHSQFALKTIHNVFATLNSCRRVYREVKMLGELKHENLLAIHDFLRPQDKKFDKIDIITELMETDLNRILLGPPQNLEPSHFRVFMYQILRGLKYLHSAGIMHRDMKPHNVLVNSNCLVKICDFGFARAINNEPKSHEVVTQFYRAPEILMGARQYSEAIDLWATGCIFAEMMTRRVLFEAESVVNQIERIVELLGKPNEATMAKMNPAMRSHVKMLERSRGPRGLPLNFEFFQAMCRQSHLDPMEAQAAGGAFELLLALLDVDCVKRATAEQALSYGYLAEGRERFHREIHSELCPCLQNPYNVEPTVNRTEIAWASCSGKNIDRMVTMEVHEDLFQYIRRYPLPPGTSQPLFADNAESYHIGDFSKCVV